MWATVGKRFSFLFSYEKSQTYFFWQIRSFKGFTQNNYTPVSTIIVQEIGQNNGPNYHNSICFGTFVFFLNSVTFSEIKKYAENENSFVKWEMQCTLMNFQERGTIVSKIPLGKDVFSFPYMKMTRISLLSIHDCILNFRGRMG